MSCLGLSTNDPTSYSEPEKVRVTDIKISLEINFEKTNLIGNVILAVDRVDATESCLVLDIKDIKVENVTFAESGEKLQYTIHDPILTFGSKLSIELPKVESKTLTIKIQYETSSKASGLQWLNPEQTAGKKYPYVFSQCQAIHCRSIIPCQDTPSSKVTYSAEIFAPEALTVLMSAIRDGEPESLSEGRKLFKFTQKVPVPSYLIAVACGRLVSRKIGPRSHVWSEEEIIDKAAYEFEETDSMLQAAEKICGKYVWGIYDLLVLPPSFPFGGMENPCLTFVTPTVLAGDRSLVDVVAHEISHSWTGNLVTNATFEHFWLNEGFTMFVERKITSAMHGKQYRDYGALVGLKDLVDSAGDRSLSSIIIHEISHSWTGNLVTNADFQHFWLNEGFTKFVERKIIGALYGEEKRYFEALNGLRILHEAVQTFGETHKFTKLVVDLNGSDPDDAFSTVPYEKGHTFLYYLETLAGGPDVFDPFLKAYIENFKYKSIKTDDFKNYLYEYFPNNIKLKTVDWDSWLYQPGMPPVIPKYDTTLQDACTKLATKWIEWSPKDDDLTQEPLPFSKQDLEPLSSNQVRGFLAILNESGNFLLAKAKAMSKAYDLNAVKNAEIKFQWIRLCIKAKWIDQLTFALDFLNEQGRMKYVRPIYRDLSRWSDVRDKVLANYETNKKGMMFVCAHQLSKDLQCGQ